MNVLATPKDMRAADGDFTTDGGAQAAAQLLAAHPDIDALFVASDLMAVGALAALAGAGRLVPGDVAVVGYDNLGAATTTSPTLTTIVNLVVAMARTAGEMLARYRRAVALRSLAHMLLITCWATAALLGPLKMMKSSKVCAPGRSATELAASRTARI